MWLRQLKLRLCDNLEEVEGRVKREGTYVYLWLIHVDVWQKSTQYCKTIIFQLKINNNKKKRVDSLDSQGQGQWCLGVNSAELCQLVLLLPQGQVTGCYEGGTSKPRQWHCYLEWTRWDTGPGACWGQRSHIAWAVILAQAHTHRLPLKGSWSNSTPAHGPGRASPWGMGPASFWQRGPARQQPHPFWVLGSLWNAKDWG